MAVLTADLESQVTELCDEAFEAFCEDVSSMFGADVRCTREHAGMEPVTGLRKRFKKLTAVHLVQATGLLDGTFQLLFDQGGFFVLSGVIVMLPETRILDHVKSGHADDAENLTDAAREVGNLLVGSWDRVFREGCDQHKHFVKTSTYIGKPWDHLEEVGLSADENVWLGVYQMTVDSYPSFRCAVLLPKALLAEDMSAGGKPATAEATPPKPAPEPEPSLETESAPEPEPQPAPASKAEEPNPAPESSTDVQTSSQTEAAESTEPVPPPPEPIEPKQEPAAPPVAKSETVQEAVPTSDKNAHEAVESGVSWSAPVEDDADVAQPAATPVAASPSKAQSEVTLENTIGIMSDERAAALIDQVFEEHAVCPVDTGIRDLLDIPARDIMTKDVVWCDPDDAVQDVIATMQQHNTGYVLVGRDEVLEGLISNSNILGAMSPYLRATFAKWRRPEDDATLGIKIKWVMSRPVRTIKPDVTLAAVIENMRRYGGRCLPVMDKNGKIQGIITVFDILLRVLEADGASTWKGSPPQGPPLMV